MTVGVLAVGYSIEFKKECNMDAKEFAVDTSGIPDDGSGRGTCWGEGCGWGDGAGYGFEDEKGAGSGWEGVVGNSNGSGYGCGAGAGPW